MNRIGTGILTALVLCGTAFALPAQTEPGGTGTPSIEGTWLGTLKVPLAELRVVFNITANPDGSLSATLDSPDQGATGVPITSIRFENRRLTRK
jgi:hypothetical protein